MQPIIGDDPFATSEEDLIREYNSHKYIPQIIFLGLDERGLNEKKNWKNGKEGFVYKEHYKGQPWFAVDVTPKESVTEAAEKLIKECEGKGLTFSKGRMNLALPAQEGV